ncbi:MAG TPA: cupin domain-containing protein [Chloroflexota bacterium]|nr:cupin domain-containing protein [Chloroflexota bacterium]
MERCVVRFDEGASGKLPIPGGAGEFRILIDGEISGAQHFSLLVNEIQPGYVGDYHQHEVEHGWYILQGRGTIWIGEQEYEIGPEMAVFAPAGVPHKMASHGPEPLRYVVVYAPQGPERELRARGEQAYGSSRAGGG